MASQPPQPAEDRVVEAFHVPAGIFQRVVRYLETQPIGQALGLYQSLINSSEAILRQDPPAPVPPAPGPIEGPGKIVDTGEDPVQKFIDKHGDKEPVQAEGEFADLEVDDNDKTEAES